MASTKTKSKAKAKAKKKESKARAKRGPGSGSLSDREIERSLRSWEIFVSLNLAAFSEEQLGEMLAYERRTKCRQETVRKLHRAINKKRNAREWAELKKECDEARLSRHPGADI